MSKHTEGPWEVQATAYEGEERGQVFIVGGNLGGLVGAALPWPTEYDSGDFSRVRANARLMALAPRLLDACIAVNKCGNGGAKLSRAASDKVRAVLREAENIDAGGEQGLRPSSDGAHHD